MAEKYLVEGYEFDTLGEAEAAKKEMQAVKYLSQKTDSSSPQEVYKIYNKIIEENLFKTDIGYDYLRALEEYLMQSGIFEVNEETGVSDGQDAGEQAADDMPQEQVQSVKEKKKDDVNTKSLKDKLIFSAALNVVLIIGIIAMLYIASTSSNVNIINYETAVLDEYSGWAEELKTRESKVKEREKAVTEAENKAAALKEQIEQLEKQLKTLQDEEEALPKATEKAED
jgi:hypothetical protein